MEHLSAQQRAAYSHFGVLKERKPYYRIVVTVECVEAEDDESLYAEDVDYPVVIAEFDDEEEALNYANEIMCAVPPEYATDTP